VTGLIYVAIIAVWAVVLVPAWLRRHDHLDPGRSVDRFSRSMQTLARRPSILGVPLPSSLPDAEPVPEEARAREVLRVTRPRRRAPRAGSLRPSRAASRRVAWGLLAAATALVVALVVGRILPPIALVIPVLLTMLLLTVVRLQARRSRATTRRRRAAPCPSPARAPEERRGPDPAPATWEARSTPLPTYVTAPPAAGFPRVIDTATPGAWTAAAMLERAQQEKMHAERMARAKAEAIARARAEQAAAEARSRDEDYLRTQAARWVPGGESSRRSPRAVNE
jgi:hypothetical protein